FFRQLDCVDRRQILAPVEGVVAFVRDGTSGYHVTRQATVHNATGVLREIKRWMGSACARDSGNEEREAGVLLHIRTGLILSRARSAINNLTVIDEDGGGQWGHCNCRQWHERGDRRSGFDFTVR